MQRIDTGDHKAAEKIREEYSEYIHEDADDARTNTVVFESDVPDRVLDRASNIVADFRGHEASKYGQEDLTKRERKQIDFTETSVPTARSVKAIALGKGVSNWTDYFDPTLTVDEHREVMEEAAGDRRGVGRDLESETERRRRQAEAERKRQEQQGEQAREYAVLEADSEAAAFVRDEGVGWDFHYSETPRGTYEASGHGGELAREVQDDRSQRARSLDARKRAKITTDLGVWASAPGQYDLPGIDTIDPDLVHGNRSERARDVDEQEAAPLTMKPVEWVHDMDHLDYPGVDHPEGGDPLEVPEEDRGVPGSRDRLGPVATVPDEAIDEAPLDEMGLAPEDFEPIGMTDDPAETSEPVWGLASEEEIDMAAADPRVETAEPPAEEPEELTEAEAAVMEFNEGEMGLAELGETLAPDEPPKSGDEVLEDMVGDQPGGEAEEPADEEPVLVDDRARDEPLTAFGVDPDARKEQGQETREAVEEATGLMADDRSDPGRGAGNDVDSGEQEGLEVFGGGTRENEALDELVGQPDEGENEPLF